ncbi:MAG: type II toxin-antitoxin system HicB family antitoxin [Candidatus Competibacter sp.]
MPAARALAEHQADPDFAGWIWAVVEVPVERYFGPAEKINITLPRLLLAKIDELRPRSRRDPLRLPGRGGAGGDALERGHPAAETLPALPARACTLIAPDARTQAALLIRRARGERSLAELARSPQTSWPSARRPENPRHSPILPQLEKAAAALGKRLVLALERFGPGPFHRTGFDPVGIVRAPLEPGRSDPAPSRERTPGRRMPLGRGLGPRQSSLNRGAWRLRLPPGRLADSPASASPAARVRAPGNWDAARRCVAADDSSTTPPLSFFYR